MTASPGSPAQPARDGELKTVSRAVQVMTAFLERDQWGVSELSRHLAISKTIVHRLLGTLAASGLLTIEAGSSTYALGPLMTQLGERASRTRDMARIVRPILEQIGAATRETATLSVICDFEGLCIESVDSPQSMRMTFYRGQRFPLNAGAVGKTLLAFQDEAVLEAYLARGPLPSLTPDTIVDPDALRAEMARIRRRGHAESDGEMTPGARSVGVPVWDGSGRLLAVIVLAAPSFRLQGQAAVDAVSMLRRSADQLSAALGHGFFGDRRASVARKAS